MELFIVARICQHSSSVTDFGKDLVLSSSAMWGIFL